MSLETIAGGAGFLLGRLLLGGVLAFMGVNHFLRADQMAGYAESKGVPAPRLSVLGSGALLVGGGLSLVLGAFPILGSAALIAFLVVTTPWMHDFWNVEDPQQQQQEMTNFLKNTITIGAALVLLTLSGTAWPLALNAGL